MRSDRNSALHLTARLCLLAAFLLASAPSPLARGARRQQQPARVQEQSKDAPARNGKRTTGVRINSRPTAHVGQAATTPATAASDPDAGGRGAAPAPASAKEDERQAGMAALERERAAAAAAAESAALAEMEEKLAAERAAREESERNGALERARLEAESRQREESARLEVERVTREAADARAEAERKAAEESKARADAEARLESERKAREEYERQVAEERAAVEAAREREAGLEKERREAADRLAQFVRRQYRLNDIVAVARALNFRDPASAVALVPEGADDYRAALTEAARKDASLVGAVTGRAGTLCDPEFVGPALLFDFPDEVTTLGVLLNYLRLNTGVNFMPDGEVEDLAIKVNVSNVPWTVVLKNLLDYNDLEINCASGVVQIANRAKLAAIQEKRRKAAPLVEEYITLRYLQVTPQVTVNVAGKANNPTGGAFQTLEETINRLLKESGNTQAQVARVPNRNELFIRAPADTLASIKRLIARADRESYVVIVRASTYQADERRLRDIGLQTALTLSDAQGMNLGGFSSLPPVTGSGGAGDAPAQAGLNPGGVPGLPAGFRVPTNGLGAVSPVAVLGGSGLFGTFQFSVQLSALQQRGIVNVQERPSLLVNNGDTGVLEFGRTIAVAVQAVGSGNLATGQLELLNAGSALSVTPSVAEDDQGNPAFVTLDVRLESNNVDTSVQTQTAPSIVRRAIQTRYVMGNNQTVVFSAFSADSTTRQRTKTPFFGDLPGVGLLFRRKLDEISRARTYFTISVEIVRQSQIINVATPPADASPNPVPPPDPQKPSPFKKDGDKQE